MRENPMAKKEALVQGKNYRFTILTPSLIRMEYNTEGRFEDRATQIAVNRDFSVPEYLVKDLGESVRIETEYLTLTYRKTEFSDESLMIKVLLDKETGANQTWSYGDKAEDLGGTARTLDTIDGETPLGQGLLSKKGYSLIDDSKSMVMTQNGWVESRTENSCDFYFFGYGLRYQECIQDFYRLAGKTPLLPRWALGNWWSRYYQYSETEYKSLMKRFQKERLPFTVAVLDMDWHLVDIPKKYGSGWTGYTWNRELFPNPPAFLEWIHKQGMKVTLNMHPADGIRGHEAAYRQMANALGKEAESEEAIEFDITNPRFLEAYFEILHHPMEEEGVDFWWIDWQQGTKTKIPGLDPLWMLNHFHYMDSMRKNEYGLTFSRYAGIGSHRYPIGFSGDTIISWKSLAFQPYFTANASNIGYGWWSHDIGGHMFGTRDDELTVRWMQFGVFSPINRLHSTNNPFSGKEPWNYHKRAEVIMGDLLRLRHELIPYLYTMNRYASRDGRPLIRPLYWEEPKQKEAYDFPNEYYFGTQLLAAPITEPSDRESDLAKVNVWLPKGTWFDYQGTRMYEGGRKMTMFRTLEEIPVFAKAGAIVVRSKEDGNTTENPSTFAVDIFPGNNGSFTLWEDNGFSKEDKDENWGSTHFELSAEEEIRFIISPIKGNEAVAPKQRNWSLHFRYVEKAEAKLWIDGQIQNAVTEYDEQRKTAVVSVTEVMTGSCVEVVLKGNTSPVAMKKEEQVFEVLKRAQICYDTKEEVLEIVKAEGKNAIASLQTIELSKALMGALTEILFAE